MDSRTDQTEERVSLLNTGDLKIVDDEWKHNKDKESLQEFWEQWSSHWRARVMWK
jgi:hypothetical protein